MLASLDERFDAHLAQAENLQALFVALNDQVFEIRELAICTVGRLSSMNPAFVMPFLRKMLIQVRTGLSSFSEYVGEVRGISPFWKIFITQLSRFQEVFLMIDIWTEALRMYWRGKDSSHYFTPHSSCFSALCRARMFCASFR